MPEKFEWRGIRFVENPMMGIDPASGDSKTAVMMRAADKNSMFMFPGARGGGKQSLLNIVAGHVHRAVSDAFMIPRPFFVPKEDVPESAYTTATNNSQSCGNNLTIETVNEALRLMRQAREPDPLTHREYRDIMFGSFLPPPAPPIPPPPPITAAEVRAGMAHFHHEFHARWQNFGEELFRHGVPGMFWDDEKTWRPKRARAFRWSSRLPDTINFAGMTARLIADNQASFDESAVMGHCLFRLHRVDMYKGLTVAYHVDHPPHLENFKNGITVTVKICPVTERWHDAREDREMVKYDWGKVVCKVDEIRGKGNSRPADRQVQDFADFIANTVESFLTDKVITPMVTR